jgi:regulator of nonsense transcripts 2
MKLSSYSTKSSLSLERSKYSNIHLLAIILVTIHRYHQDFAISVVDDLLESITFGLELNDFKFNQRRIAEVKYLGEMYIYRLVDSPLIFDTLYKLLNFGWEGGYARPGLINPLDLPDDYFRIRLVCSLLETCGMYYDKGAAKKKLDFFLTYFQLYLCVKESLPMDVDFMVQDAFSLTRPNWKLITDLDDASYAFAEAVKSTSRPPLVNSPNLKTRTGCLLRMMTVQTTRISSCQKMRTTNPLARKARFVICALMKA